MFWEEEKRTGGMEATSETQAGGITVHLCRGERKGEGYLSSPGVEQMVPEVPQDQTTNIRHRLRWTASS